MRAVFEFFVRRLPRERNFLVAAGLEQVLEFLECFKFADEEIQWLASTKRFRPAFLDQLAQLRFSGDVEALPEGTILFPNEPVLRIMVEGEPREAIKSAAKSIAATVRKAAAA